MSLPGVVLAEANSYFTVVFKGIVMNLGSVMSLSAAAREAFDNGDDAAVLEEINRPLIKRTTRGHVSAAGMADVSVELATMFLVAMTQKINSLAQGDELEQAQAILFNAFFDRFKNADEGLDLANETLRGYVTATLIEAGWDETSINIILALGYILESPMQYVFQRDATEADVAGYRVLVEQESVRQAYDSLITEYVQTPYNNGNRDAIILGLQEVIAQLAP